MKEWLGRGIAIAGIWLGTALIVSQVGEIAPDDAADAIAYASAGACVATLFVAIGKEFLEFLS